MSHKIMIMCQEANGGIDSVTYELISCANLIAHHYNSQIIAVLPNAVTSQPNLPDADLLVINSPSLAEYTAEAWEKAALLAIEEIKPDIIIVAHNAVGYDYAPRLAAHLDGACISSVNKIIIEDQQISYSRSSLHGKYDLLYRADGDSPLVITVLPGAFPPKDSQENLGRKKVINADIKLTDTTNIKYSLAEQANTELEDAISVIAVGRGIGKEENLILIQDLATCFNRPAIAGSRAAYDNGWIEYNAQVGITGKKIAPPLYIACGISGSFQHIAGMMESKTIVSINRDPAAAIFRYSDICIVEELERFIPVFIEEAKRRG